MVILHESAHPKLNFKKIVTKHQYAVRILFHEEKEARARRLLKKIHAINVCPINIIQTLTFIQKVQNSAIPRVFFNTFEETKHKYRTRFSKYYFKQSPTFINYAKFSTSCRGSEL